MVYHPAATSLLLVGVHDTASYRVEFLVRVQYLIYVWKGGLGGLHYSEGACEERLTLVVGVRLLLGEALPEPLKLARSTGTDMRRSGQT